MSFKVGDRIIFDEKYYGTVVEAPADRDDYWLDAQERIWVEWDKPIIGQDIDNISSPNITHPMVEYCRKLTKLEKALK